ncbi:MAG: VCBS repeat-containing protein [Smithella sp.]|nr:VCBS repeat-containing protein [Smithella sp.]
MRKYSLSLFLSAIILLTAATLWAKDKYTVTILPFSLHSAENIDYVKQGIDVMLSSRLAASDKISLTDKNALLAEIEKSKIKEISVNDVQTLGKNLNSDYVVWGSITKIGNSISIDGKLVDISKTKSDVNLFTQAQNLDEVMPKVNEFSQSILQHIIGTAPQAVTLPTVAATAGSTTTPPPPATETISRESQIIANMKAGGKKGGTLTSVINAEFINAVEPFNRKEFWMSQKIPTEFKGMDIGDVNNDGSNEVVVIDRNTVYIYLKSENELKLLEKIKGKSYSKYLAVDVADINKNGVKEIIVTSLNDTLLDSFVLEFKDGKYSIIAADIRWFLRVIHTSSGAPLLLGQDYGSNKPFDTQIYEMVWKDGKYVSDQKMKIPFGLSIYGLAIDDLGIGGGEKIFALDELDYLYVLQETNKSLGRLTSLGFAGEELVWKSDEVYGGSNNYFENIDKKNPDDRGKSAYVNLRILSYDTNKDGKKELIIVKNLSSVGRIFKHFKLFTSCEIYNLQWDGMGMAENWRTKKINGYVADYCLKDVDNDGQPEIVLALNLNVGVSIKEKSVIVIYELEGAQ